MVTPQPRRRKPAGMKGPHRRVRSVSSPRDNDCSIRDQWRAALLRLDPDLPPHTDPAAPLAGSDSAEERSASADVRTRALAEVLGIPYEKHPGDWSPSSQFVERVPISFARQYAVLGITNGQSEDAPLTVVLGSVEHWQQLDVLSRFLGRCVQPLLAPVDVILTAINAAYQQRSDQSQSLVEGLDVREDLDDVGGLIDREDLLDTSARPPVIKLVNSILFEAVRARASDVHVQPHEDQVVVRQRVDGVLFDTLKVPKDYQEEIVSRLKVLGRMNIAEKRLPQDGRATVNVGDRLIDLRIASLPTSFGERVVIRFLDKSARLYTLEELGMSPQTLTRFRRLIKMDHGLLLATGPTGSGKSTTLYAALKVINAKDLNVLTLEDPIEYHLEGISQTQINPKKGMTFASGLRNVLRQDPDIIMVGEIRDHETAVMAIQSALTGHLVFSTLHTNDAASAITRLLDLGIEPYLVASSVVAVVAQRLVRRVCRECRTSKKADPTDAAQLSVAQEAISGQTLYCGAGCDRCRQTGYTGRVGVFELLEVEDSIRQLIQARASASQIRTTAVAGGMRLFRDDGLAKALDGVTTIDEVVRVTMGFTQ